MADHHDFFRIRDTAQALKLAVIDRPNAFDDELKSFLAVKPIAVGLLDDVGVASLNDIADRAQRLQRVTGSLDQTGAPEERWKLISWFVENEPALDLHSDLIAGSR